MDRDVEAGSLAREAPIPVALALGRREQSAPVADGTRRRVDVVTELGRRDADHDPIGAVARELDLDPREA